ncbi:Nucleoside-diphosphate-sugar epimerase [Saccharicrinis carchari]|uniref:Nucleoside-diphosphate-sugar epimerase n=2 Tax=Saccharicrinis carchari TaxID=1168039 RepID=A0A521D3R7_SACCC|nr:Nucleoside-diphosphate-sugar epimerase [Saccharicrinis carchari]
MGCGWLGLPLAGELVNNGYTVNGSTTNPDKIEQIKAMGAHPYLIHIGKRNNPYAEFLHAHILIVAITSKSIEDFKYLMEKINASPIKKVIFISSTSVYPSNNTVVNEITPVKDVPLVRIEQLFRSNPNIATTVIRFAGLYGYNRKPGNFFPEGRIIDHPEGYVNFIHRDDCIRIIQKIIISETWNQLFNGCTDTHPTRREFYTSQILKVGRTKPAFNEEASNAYKIVDNKKIKDILHFTFKYPNLMNGA